MKRAAVGLACVWMMAAAALGAEVGAEEGAVATFLKTQCYDCHSSQAQEGGLDLETLARRLGDRANFAKWERIYDRVYRGEMPPKSVEPPDKNQRDAFLTSLRTQLVSAHAATKGTVLRRLNRREYQNTLNDLFGTNLKLVDLLPEDGRSHEFDTVGEALSVSMVQMQRYLEGAEAALDASIQKTLAPPENKIVRASYADTRGAEQWLGKVWLKREDGAVVFFKQYGYPSGMLREAGTRVDGWYKVRVRAYAYQSAKPVTFSIGATTFARGLEEPTFGYFAVPPDEPTTVEVKTWIPKNYMIELTPYGISDENWELKNKGVFEYAGAGLAIQWIEVEGPLTDEFPSRGHKLVFEGLERKEILPRNPADRERPWYQPKYEVTTSGAHGEVSAALGRVAAQAFRRPVQDQEIAPYLALFEAELTKGATVEQALRTAVTAVFCSPEFLFLREPKGKLDDWSLASRLSYFLTRTLPDEELRKAAASGKLATDDSVLAAQVERLLADPRSERFVVDFTDAWLNLREIEFTNPDKQLFPEFDPFLKHSSVSETRAFFRKLLDENLSVHNVVRSDFAMLNNRLAEHYGIDGVEGPEIRAVNLPAESVRGGLLSQASVLKVSANGTTTSPVVRGVWVMERILGQTPPPLPPGIPGVEPDIRGATTLRELLDKHRSLDTCRGCHAIIDPPGFALESFDPIGGWRERFRSLGDGEKVTKSIGGFKVRYKLGLPVDASGELPDGREFAGFQEFRGLLANDEDTLARALATKLLTFSTGREMGFSDRDEIERIVRESAAAKHGVRNLVRLVATSEIFKNK